MKNRTTQITTKVWPRFGRDRIIRRALAVVAVLLVSRGAMAGYPYVESIDAGDETDPQMTFNQGYIGVSLTLDTISGSLDNGDFVDAYCIEVVDPVTFQATTSAAHDARASADFDTRLYLFRTPSADAPVEPWMANDDSPAAGTRSVLTNPPAFPGSVVDNPQALVPGRYILAVNGFPDEVRDEFGGVVFAISSNFQALVGPGLFGADSWDTSGTNRGSYTIALTGVKGCGPNIAFITDSTGSGDLSTWTHSGGQTGVAGADAVCQWEADTADLPGTYKAYMSDSNNDAYCHVIGETGKVANDCNTGGAMMDDEFSWVAETYLTFIHDFRAAIADKEVFYPFFSTLGGNQAGEFLTGTDKDGVHSSGYSCSDWTHTSGEAALGSPYSGADLWSNSSFSVCSASRRLLCMRSEPGPRAARPRSFGDHIRSAFVTSAFGTGDLSSWADAGGATGLDAGDAVCRAEATAAGLEHADSYVAFLSTTAIDAKDRLPNDGYPWARTDMTHMGEWSAVAGPGPLYSNLAVHADGSTYIGSTGAYTGTDTDGTVILTATCSDWTSETDDGGIGDTSRSTESWKTNPFNPYPCNYHLRLYCFETAVPGIFTDGFESGDTLMWSAVGP